MDPLVSVLIPAYNSQKWIGATIESVLNQTWPHLEVIIVDDGSPDNTLSIARGYESSNVLVHKQENAGAPTARNKAFELSQGDYIQWLDADDILDKNKIKSQMDRLLLDGSGPKTTACGHWGHFFYRTNKTQFLNTSLCKDLDPVDWLVHKMAENLHMQTATWLVSRETTENAGPWNPELISDDDGEYFCRVILESDRILFVPESKVHYRITDSGSWGSLDGSGRKLEAQWRSMNLHFKYLLSLENSGRTRSACVSYINTWCRHFYPNRPDLVEEMRKSATSFGGEMREIAMSWKWAWIAHIFGYTTAKSTASYMRKIRLCLIRRWDEFAYSFSQHNQ